MDSGRAPSCLVMGQVLGKGPERRLEKPGRGSRGRGVSDRAGPQDRCREARAVQSLPVLPAQNWAGGGGAREGALQLTWRGQQGAAALLDPRVGGRRLGVPVRGREGGTWALRALSQTKGRRRRRLSSAHATAAAPALTRPPVLPQLEGRPRPLRAHPQAPARPHRLLQAEQGQPAAHPVSSPRPSPGPARGPPRALPASPPPLHVHAARQPAGLGRGLGTRPLGGAGPGDTPTGRGLGTRPLSQPGQDPRPSPFLSHLSYVCWLRLL